MSSVSPSSRSSSFSSYCEISIDALSNSFSSTAASINWLIHERFGLAKLVGRAMVPSQFTALSRGEAHGIIEQRVGFFSCVRSIEKIKITGENGVTVQGVIIYPKSCVNNTDMCVLYHNPNGATVAEIIEVGFGSSAAPFYAMRRAKCPLIMYDYRGTGISDPGIAPSAHTISVDGIAALEYAMQKFSKVEVWGSSLGGGVATVALDAYLTKYPDRAERLSLYNHDSFRTTGKVVLPPYLNFLATIFGGNLDAESAMRRLAKRKSKVVVLCHSQDPVIPRGARMAEIAPELGSTAFLIESPLKEHATLSDDMINALHWYQ